MEIKFGHDKKGQVAICPFFSSFGFTGRISVEDFLKELGLSKAWIKKYGPAKSFLAKTLTSESQELFLSENLLNRFLPNPRYTGPEVKILQETEHFLALNKPPCVHSHPLVYEDRENCLSALREMGRGELLLPYQGAEADAGLLYRLDYETSGCLLYAKFPEIKDEIFRQREKSLVEKIYRCRVRGEVFADSDQLVHFFAASEKKGKKMQVFDSGSEGDDSRRKGLLSFHKIAFDKSSGTTELEVKLQSGLRHQIRAQLAHIGHPIVGDPLYGEGESDRLYLHAKSYTLNWGGETHSFSSEEPWDSGPFS